MYKYQNYGRLLAFKLGGGATPLPPKRVPQQTPEPPVLAGATPEMEMRGAMLFGRCATCHGARGEARLAAYPDLFRLSPETHAIFKDIVLGGRLSANGMASFADALTEQDVEALHAFLVREQRKLREEELAAAAKERQPPGARTRAGGRCCQRRK
jgi:quinohemoprotein ethanol dehydrogenase